MDPLSSKATAYPKPATQLTTKPINPRPLAPIRLHAASFKPTLKDQWIRANQEYQFLPSWIRTTHVVPAATPRSFAHSIQVNFTNEDSKMERRTKVTAMSQSLFSKKVAHEHGETVEGTIPAEKQPTLVNVLDRYVLQGSTRKSTGSAVTLFFAHANGFPKRIWEPTLRALLQRQEDAAYCGPLIEEVWSFEAVNHGDSALLNEDNLGDLFDWLDNSRDMLNFLAYYLPPKPGTSLPTVLLPVSEEDAEARLKRGFSNRKIIGIGHSIGGCTMSRAAIDSAPLWSSIILIDPIIIPGIGYDPVVGSEQLILGALSRRMRWPSRKEAKANFLRNDFFRAWDTQVLETYLEEGIGDDPTRGDVRLKQSGFQEACSFVDRRASYETWEVLGNLDARIRLFWIMSGQDPVATGPAEITRHTVWRRPDNSSNVRIPGTGHLIVHEAPLDLAKVILGFLSEGNSIPLGMSKL